MISKKSIWTTLVLSFGIIILLIGTYSVSFVTDWIFPSQPSGISEESPRVTPNNEQRAEIVIKPFTRLITDKGKPELEINAAEAQINTSEKIHTLTQINQVVFYGKDNRRYYIAADTGYWDQVNRVFEIKGNVTGRIEEEGKPAVEMNCQILTYRSSDRTLIGKENVSIAYGPYHTTGDIIYLNTDDSSIRFDGNIRSKIKSEAFNHAPINVDSNVEITASSIFYNHSDSRLEYSGNPTIVSGTSRMKGGLIQVSFGIVQQIMISNGVDIFIQPNESENDSRPPIHVIAEIIRIDLNAGEILIQKNVRAQRLNLTIHADEVRFQLDYNTRELLGGSAFGNVSFQQGEMLAMAHSVVYNPLDQEFILSESAQIQYRESNSVTADVIYLFSDRRYCVADGNVNIQFQPPASVSEKKPVQKTPIFFANFNNKDPLFVQCNHVEIDQLSSVVSLNENVRGRQSDFIFGADSLRLDFTSNMESLKMIHANGNVSFSQQDKVVTGGKFSYEDASGIAEIWENPSFWQEKNHIKSGRFTYSRNTQILEMKEHLEMTLTVPEQSDAITFQTDSSIQKTESTVQIIHVKSESGKYNELLSEFDFIKDVSVNWGVWRIVSDTMRVELTSQNGTVRNVFANGNVRILHELFDASGASLTYAPQDSIIILKGSDTEQCMVKKGMQGSLGDEIKFFTRENRFVIEKGSSVVMPSEFSEKKK